MSEATLNPNEDLKHAHELLACMSAEELHSATLALEDIVENSPWFREKLAERNAAAEASGWVGMDEVLADHGLTQKDLESSSETVSKRSEAA